MSYVLKTGGAVYIPNTAQVYVGCDLNILPSIVIVQYQPVTYTPDIGKDDPHILLEIIRGDYWIKHSGRLGVIVVPQFSCDIREGLKEHIKLWYERYPLRFHNYEQKGI